MKSKAFAPAHISGFFIPKITGSVERSGSLGAGICLSDGVTAEVIKAQTASITLNGEPFHCKPLEDALLLLTEQPLKISLTSTVPIGAGFGISGACILAALLAANQLLEIGFTKNQLAQIAHRAEVSNKTGLGDIPAQITGGIVIRLRQGVPPYSRTDQIPAGNTPLSWACFKEISTKEILENATLQRQIIKSGRRALKNLLQKPTLENLMLQSKKFTEEIEIASREVVDAIEAAEATGITAAQAMLGDTVFALGEKVFSEYQHSGTSLINHTGAIQL
jgi:pantoate kinase